MNRQQLAAELADKFGSDLAATQDAVDSYAGQLQDEDLYDTENDQLSADGVEVIRQQFADDQETTAIASDILNQIIVAEANRKEFQDRADEATASRDALIRKAVSMTIRVADIAEAADLKPARIYQIRDGRR